MGKETASLSKSTATISIFTTISRITGFIALLVLASALGDGALADSYNLANTIPNMLFELVLGGILTSLFIPFFMDHLLRDREDVWRIASNIINISTLLLIIVAVIGTVFSFYFIRMQTFLVNADSEKVRLASYFFKFFVWEIVFYGFATVMNGVLQSFKKFTAPAAAPIFNNLVTIAAVIFLYTPFKEKSPLVAVLGLAIGTTFGVVSMALIQLPALLRSGYKHYWILDFKDESFRRMAVLSLPIIGYVASNQLGQLVVNVLAYQFDGGFTAWTYAWRFYQLPYGILAVSISTALFPIISEKASKADIKALKGNLSLGVRTTGFVIIPATALIFVLSRPLIIAALRHGDFTTKGALQTADVLAFFVLGLLPFSLHMFLTKIFYALKDTVTPMKMNALGVPLMVVMDIVLVRYFDVAGLSLGNSLTYVFTVMLLMLSLRSRIGPLGARLMVKKTIVFTAAATFSAGLVYAINQISAFQGFGFIQNLIIVMIGFTVGTATYLLINYLFKTEETEFVWGMIRGILGTKRSG